jgi:hypothetical protein
MSSGAAENECNSVTERFQRIAAGDDHENAFTRIREQPGDAKDEASVELAQAHVMRLEVERLRHLRVSSDS